MIDQQPTIIQGFDHRGVLVGTAMLGCKAGICLWEVRVHGIFAVGIWNVFSEHLAKDRLREHGAVTFRRETGLKS